MLRDSCLMWRVTRLHCRGLQLAPDVDLGPLAHSCFGYSGADLAALVREAAMHAFSTAAAHILQQGEGELLFMDGARLDTCGARL
jgi:ATP-dependent 26S proteasome regulatory subunit